LSATSDWRELLRQPRLGDHVVQVYQDDEFLEEAVRGYLCPGLAAGEAAILIAVPEHRARFASLDPAAVARGQVLLLDAEETLGTFMREGLPDGHAIHRVIGGAIAKLRLDYPAVRAYGEMVDVLWQRGSREAAIRLEEQWNELMRLQTFTLLCAYRMDPLDPGSYGGPLESICGCHSHLIPARDYAHLDEAVAQAARDVLDEGLAGMLLSLAARSRTGASMPLGQATLLWLKRNMPLTAEKVLAGVRARC